MPKPSVLIIDDEPVVRTAVQTALKREEYDLIYAENGEEGLSLALNHLPTVIILDIRMPGMGGIEFLAKLKLSPSDPYSVIVLSGHGNAGERRECYDAGVNIFLRKPFDMYEVRGVVRNAVALQQVANGLDDLVRERNAELENRVQEITALNELFRKQLAQTDERSSSTLEDFERLAGEISSIVEKLRNQDDSSGARRVLGSAGS